VIDERKHRLACKTTIEMEITVIINNNKQICIVPLGRNFRGAGARQRVSEQRKDRKPGRKGMPLSST